jgi:predicted Fe-S protein YdhL (DUF1289 family)
VPTACKCGFSLPMSICQGHGCGRPIQESFEWDYDSDEAEGSPILTTRPVSQHEGTDAVTRIADFAEKTRISEALVDLNASL